MPSSSTGFKDAARSVYECLDQGGTQASWLPTMLLHTTASLPSDLGAIGIDTNILKVLRRAPLITDNLRTFVEDRRIPLIIPGQSAQEYWNNHGAIVRDIEGVTGALEALKKKVANLTVTEQQQHTVLEIEANIERLAAEMHDARRPELMNDSVKFWENVLPKAVLCNVPRASFKSLAEVRFASKTAPGFADTKKGGQSLGDFYVWADFLLGLLVAGLGSSTAQDRRVIFVTDDDKSDWKASGKPHPVLIGEVKALTGMHLEILGSKEFEALISPK